MKALAVFVGSQALWHTSPLDILQLTHHLQSSKSGYGAHRSRFSIRAPQLLPLCRYANPN